MPYNAASPVRRQKHEVDVPDTGWSDPQGFALGSGGMLVRSTLRAPAGSTVTEVDLLVWVGPEELPPGFDPSTVPEEDRILDRQGVAVTGSAVVADDDFHLESVGVAAPFDSPFGQRLWGAIKAETASAAQDGVVWALTAKEAL